MKSRSTDQYGHLIAVTLAVMAVLWPGAARADGSAAHNLAQKFAVEPKVQQPDLLGAALAAEERAVADRKHYEQDLLKRARDEASRRNAAALLAVARRKEQRRVAATRLRAAENARQKFEAEAKRARADASRLARELKAVREAAKLAALQRRRDDELRQLTEKLKQASAARKARNASVDKQRIENERKLAEKAAAEAAKRKQAAIERKAQELAAAQAAATAAQEEAQRLAELDANSRAELIAREKRAAGRDLGRDSGGFEDNFGGQGAPAQGAPAQGPLANERRVAILLVMKPGNRGIRRHNKTADPVLCEPNGCYISSGSRSPARFLSRRRALGFFNTHGRRAGACNRSLGCIFRNVDLGVRTAILQPVDLRVIRHDRRQRQVVKAPSRCTARAGRLHCSGAFTASDYIMWVVPESVAAAAGPQALENALASGLAASGLDASGLDAGAARSVDLDDRAVKFGSNLQF